MAEKACLCIDLKSFYASVECVERGLDPLTTNLAVADPERSEKTVCLAITPSMKALGIKNRCRVFQIPKEVQYIMAPPRMKLYIEYSADIYAVYLKYAAKEDIHVYSIDEAFLDVTDYLSMYQLTAKELAQKIMKDVQETTGITAVAGIGTNLYLAKIALDIMAKHAKDNIGWLDEARYRKVLWKHKPLTDFWRIGSGTQKRLAQMGILTMEDVTRADEDTLFRIFGVDAELLIDHAWGRESTTIADIKAYQPKSSSLSNGQVLARDYSYEECRLIIKEMTDVLCLDMMAADVVTDSVSLMIGYSAASGLKPASGSLSLPSGTNLYDKLIPHVLKLYEKIADRNQPIRRLNLSCNRLANEAYVQYDLFSDPDRTERAYKMQKTALEIKKRFGKNALVRGMDLEDAATTMERNRQIGGHKSGE